MVLEKGLEPLRLTASDPKSDASAIPPLKRVFNCLDLSNFFGEKQPFLQASKAGSFFARKYPFTST